MEQSPQQLVADADRLRRSRRAERVVSQAAPIVAGVMLVFAGASRFFGGSRWIPLVALGLAVAGLAVYWWAARRERPTTDAIASQVDGDAALRGELRSAHWFETSGERGTAPEEWAQYHLSTASRRAAAIEWVSLYPAVKAARQWAGSAVMAVAVVGLSLYMPARATSPNDLAKAIGDPDLAAAMSPEMAAKLAALLEDMKKAALNKDAQQLTLEEMKKLLANMDPALQKKLLDLLEKQAKAGELAKNKQELNKDARPERAENNSGGLPEDVKWALDDMANRKAQEGQRQTNPNNPSASEQTAQQGMGSQQAEKAQMQQSASPMVREAASETASKMMMGGGGPMGGDSGPGAGGKKNEQTAMGNVSMIAQALKKEMVEAAEDALGKNEDKEDRRKKTEQGKSTLGYTRVAPAAFEPSRSAAPPPVPEARRQLMLNYFIRKK